MITGEGGLQNVNDFNSKKIIIMAPGIPFEAMSPLLDMLYPASPVGPLGRGNSWHFGELCYVLPALWALWEGGIPGILGNYVMSSLYYLQKLKKHRTNSDVMCEN